MAGGLFKGTACQPDFIIPVATYVVAQCVFGQGPNCVPEKLSPPLQPATLDTLGDRLMFRMTYRNFGDHESLLVSHTSVTTADAMTGATRTGVRWYEIRNLSTTPTVFQQSTFAPLDPTNPLWRWMGSAAMDHSGDIAVGYSASGPNYFPSLHYAGRLATDPLNELTQGEAVMFVGLGIQEFALNRWGDYSDLTVDPADDCTFWYTNEYAAANTITGFLSVNWHTRIGSFKFPQCVPAVLQLVSVKSRMTHGSAGTFDIDLPLTGPRGVECRSSASLGPGNYTMVFNFLNAMTNCGAASTGSVSSGPNSNQCTVNLTGVPNQQYLTVTLTGAVDSTGATGNVSGTMGVLLGDVNATGRVDGSDVTQVRQNNFATLDQTTGTFRNDVNASGRIDGTDVTITRQQNFTSLPTPP